MIPKKWSIENEVIFDIEKGSAMLMKSLLLYASNRTTNNKRRRVIHLEFNSHQHTKQLGWSEYERMNLKKPHINVALKGY